MTVDIILTGTIVPNVDYHVSLQDPAVRLAQYQRAVVYWAEATRTHGSRLSFLETSGFSRTKFFSELPSWISSRLSYSSCDGSAYDTERGKGAVEFSALTEHASELVATSESETVFKATGRLVVYNATSVLPTLPEKSFMVRQTLDGTFADTRLFGCSRDLWGTTIQFVAETSNDPVGVYAEHALASKIHLAQVTEGASLMRFPARPAIAGVSGSTNLVYKPTRLAGSRMAAVAEKALLRFAAAKQA